MLFLEIRATVMIDEAFYMRQATKLLGTACLLLSSTLYGCATTTINAGLQAGELPPSGSFTADNGINFNVQPLTLATLPPKQVSRQKTGNNISTLVRSSGQVNYRIASSDVLSIILGTALLTELQQLGCGKYYQHKRPGYYQTPCSSLPIE